MSEASAQAPLPLLQLEVDPDWIDYNGHMTDTAYVIAFTRGVETLLEWLGIDADYRASTHHTVYTLENHVRYLKEAGEGDRLAIEVQLVDRDAKRLHVFLRMLDAEGAELATSEQMLMGIDTASGRAAPFHAPVSERIERLGVAHEALARPAAIGRPIGLRRRD